MTRRCSREDEAGILFYSLPQPVGDFSSGVRRVLRMFFTKENRGITAMGACGLFLGSLLWEAGLRTGLDNQNWGQNQGSGAQLVQIGQIL